MLDGLPRVAYRLGADLDPVDLFTDPTAGPWLEAFNWPEHVTELHTLRAAIDLARCGPLPLVCADAVWDTARLIAQVPGKMPVVVFTASLLSYLDAQARARFVAQLATAARTRPVTRAATPDTSSTTSAEHGTGLPIPHRLPGRRLRWRG